MRNAPLTIVRIWYKRFYTDSITIQCKVQTFVYALKVWYATYFYLKWMWWDKARECSRQLAGRTPPFYAHSKQLSISHTTKDPLVYVSLAGRLVLSFCAFWDSSLSSSQSCDRNESYIRKSKLVDIRSTSSLIFKTAWVSSSKSVFYLLAWTWLLWHVWHRSFLRLLHTKWFSFDCTILRICLRIDKIRLWEKFVTVIWDYCDSTNCGRYCLQKT